MFKEKKGKKKSLKVPGCGFLNGIVGRSSVGVLYMEYSYDILISKCGGVYWAGHP
jgi:hypothetical protein